MPGCSARRLRRPKHPKAAAADAEAAAALLDPHALTQEDRDVDGKQRFVTLGLGSAGRLLVVVWTQRDDDRASASRSDPADGAMWLTKQAPAPEPRARRTRQDGGRMRHGTVGRQPPRPPLARRRGRATRRRGSARARGRGTSGRRRTAGRGRAPAGRARRTATH
ncbi:hypothetical protein CKO31_16425 [Thiohalocapsa halophila]|uniref:BrnT family toxin n=1 Tax=Thiohalocapsa halophila TaxID=69359 RepID=A0ABS1CKS1_9GAMM|nr:hypothetical protein [Thiohalocapsa halophila]